MKRHAFSSLIAALLTLAAIGAHGRSATDLIESSGVKGGLIVHVGCGDGSLTADLHANDSYRVYGLDTNAANIKRARAAIQRKDLYGAISIDQFDGKSLPLIDNLVNLLVIEKAGALSKKEMTRVLAPDGVATVRKGSKWVSFTKPRADDIDEWTHYLHDPAGTMVGKDQVVGPPRRIQWVADPKWLRNHDFMSSMHAMVTANGRVIYIMDEGLRNHIFLPPHWKLIARDAFNGTLLWKRDIKDWQNHIWPMKSGPGEMPRRLVTVGDTIYVTLGFNAPVTAVDAATGDTVRDYEGSLGAEEIIVDNGKLFVVSQPDKQPTNFLETTTNWGQAKSRANSEWGWSKNAPKRVVNVYDAASGKALWEHDSVIAPMTLTLGPRRAYFFDGNAMVALDRKNGDVVWRTPLEFDSAPATGYTHRVVLSDGVLVFVHNARTNGLDAETGKELWKGNLMKTGHNSPNDIFIVNGRIWSASTGKSQTKGTAFRASDLRSGETVSEFTASNLDVYFMHQRCYPGRATERFIMTSGTGTEFYEIDGPETVDLHHYVRGSCIYGLMPANGLLYKPADSCACHYQSKVTFMTALAPGESKVDNPIPDSKRLFRGPDYAKASAGLPDHSRAIAGLSAVASAKAGDWPTHRGDASRSGSNAEKGPSKLNTKWTAKIGGELSAVTVAEGRAFVAQIDQHTIHALDAKTGKSVWSFTAGGRIDSPPTLVNGMALFGSADGKVYCVTAHDGKLAWSYQVAPGAQKTLCREQIESLWPVSGSVLVREGVAFCLAGRNMFFDGGMRLVRLDVTSGKKLSETILNETDPETGDSIQAKMPGKAMPVANPDLLSCDDRFVYMGAQKFDFNGRRVDIDAPKDKQQEQYGEGRHLFCPTGLLDDNWFHRTYMMYGRTGGEGHGEYAAPPKITPVGRVLVLDDERVYGFRAAVYSNVMNPRPYHYLYSAFRDDPAADESVAEATTRKEKRSKQKALWQVDRPSLLANAMVLAGDTIALAGPPEVSDEERAFKADMEGDNPITRSLRAQDEAWRGAQGAVLQTISKTDGAMISEAKLDALPVFDGMSAANGALFIALQNGEVICVGE